MAGARGCCSKGPIKSTSIRMHGAPFFSPYMQDLGGALLMSFQNSTHMYTYMHRIASPHKLNTFGTYHTFAESFHVSYHSTPKTPRLFGLILFKVITIKFSAMISFKNVYTFCHNLYHIIRYSEVREVSLHLRYREPT